MNFIGSDCVGARLYEQLGMQFNNPFCWSRLSYKDFVFLMHNLNKIDFKNVDIKIVNDPKITGEYVTKCGLVLIDNKIKALYPHYIQNSKYDTPTKKDVNIYYNNIQQYVTDKYTLRESRFNLQDKTYFILHQKQDREGYDISAEDCINFIHLKTPFRKILVIHDKELLDEKSNDTDIVFCNNSLTTTDIAKKILVSIKL